MVELHYTKIHSFKALSISNPLVSKEGEKVRRSVIVPFFFLSKRHVNAFSNRIVTPFLRYHAVKKGGLDI